MDFAILVMIYVKGKSKAQQASESATARLSEEDWCHFLALVTHTQVQQEFHQQLFVQKNPVFQQAPDFLYQPVDSDTVNPAVVPLN